MTELSKAGTLGYKANIGVYIGGMLGEFVYFSVYSRQVYLSGPASYNSTIVFYYDF